MKLKSKVLSGIMSCILGMTIMTSPIVALDYETGNDSYYHETIMNENIAQGMEYETVTRFSDIGFVDLHILKVDLTNEYVSMDVVRSMETFGLKTKVTDLVEQTDNGVAGVNASFFNVKTNPSDIVGTEFSEDFVVTQDEYNKYGQGAASLIQTDLGNYIDYVTTEISFVNENNMPLEVFGINKITNYDRPIIFNEKAISNTEEIEGLESLYKLAVEDGQIIDMVGPGEASAVPKGGYVLVFKAYQLETIEEDFPVGTYVDLKIEHNFPEEVIKMIISGGAKIIENGEIVTSDYITSKNSRQPRTAIGLTEDGNTLIAMVVDGRGPSIGATHNELGEYLLENNVYNAIHFDGGGSSSLVARNFGEDVIGLKNRPSDGYERKVVNALAFESDAPKEELLKIKATTDTNRVFINSPIQIKVLGIDTNYNPYPLEQSQIVYESKGVEGIFSGNTFIPSKAGEGSIICSYGNQQAVVSISAVDDYIDLDIKERILEVDYNSVAQFKVYATDTGGYRAPVNVKNIQYTLSNPEIGHFENGVFKSGSIPGVSKVILSANGRETSGYVVVGSEEEKINHFEDISVETAVYPEEVIGTVELTDEYYVTDDDAIENGIDLNQLSGKSLRITYDFIPSDATQAVYAAFEPYILNIPEHTKKISLKVKGEPNEIMLRGKIVDSEGNSYNVTFADDVDYEDFTTVETGLPEGIVYPAYLERIYVTKLSSEQGAFGHLYIDDLRCIKAYQTKHLRFDFEGIISDELLVHYPKDNDMHISVFGATAGRNRLLDEVIMQKVYGKMNEADLAIFTGSTDINEGMMSAEYEVWNNVYHTVDYPQLKMIYLATSKDSLVKTDSKQWKQLIKDINDSHQNNIVLIGDANPITGFKTAREGELLHDILSEYQHKSKKNIFYINADGYEYNVNFYEGIRYIDMNGLWYKVDSDRRVYLNDTFKVLDFYLIDGVLRYQINDLYPKVQF